MPIIYYFSSIAVTVISVIYFIVVYTQSPSKEQKALQLATVCIFIFCLFDCIVAVSKNPEICEVSLYLSFIGAANIGLCYFIFLGFITHVYLPTVFKALYAFGNVVFTLFAITNSSHHLMYKEVGFEILEKGASIRHLEYGPVFWLYLGWYCLSLIIPAVVVWQCAKKKPLVFKCMRASIIAFFISEGLAFGTFIVCDLFNTDYDFSAISCCIGSCVFLIIIYKFRTYPMQQTSEEAVLNNLEDLLIAVDNKGGMVYVNSFTKRLIDHDNVFSYGMDYHHIYDDLDKIMETKQDEVLFFKGRYYVCDILDIVDGSNVMGKIHWMKDLTKENAYLEECKNLKEQAECANDAKSRFLAHMSHEIRTPINAILGMNELISREATEGYIKEYSDTINRSGKTLLALINDILDFSKIEEGKMDIVPGDYDLALAVKDLATAAKTRAATKSLPVNVEVDENLPKILNGDEVRVKQVITNILTNAVKYTSEGKVDFRVTFEKTGGNEINLIAEVSDTGIGIKEEDIPRLYERFERLDNNGNYKTEGAGLGMCITKNLLELMNGRMEVKSVYGQGSTFKISIPQKCVGNEVIGEYVEENVKEVVVEKKRNFFVAPGAEVLIVDDNTVNRIVAMSLLKGSKIGFSQADSGLTCLKKTREKKFDLILLDYRMPELNGAETLNRMRADDANQCKDTPVIVMTADAGQEAKDYFNSCGFDDYLVKPMDPEEYENMVYKYLPKEKVVLIS